MFVCDMPIEQRRETMIGLREAYIAAQRDGHNPQQRTVIRAIEVALMCVTEPLDFCGDVVQDWSHPCLCRECRDSAG